MKHKLSITILLLSIFLATQFIGLFVINAYTPITIMNPQTGEITHSKINDLPFGLQTPDDEQPTFYNLILAFLFAIALIFILMKYKWKTIIRLWFFVVTILALSISLNAFLKMSHYQLLTTHYSLIALAIAIPLASLKIFKPNVYSHNLTELLIYPGIAAVFVPILVRPAATTFLGKIWPIATLLILISLYDAWAVWKSGIMQKMASFQMNELKIFGGLMIPSLSKKVQTEIKKIKQKYKGKKIPAKIKKKKFKVNLAILGGGDIIFPIITAGVFLRTFGLIPALFVTAGAFIALTYLFAITKKDKAYPAMPYITVGIFIAIALAWKILSL
ncbi:MAG: presenilin family intramembrane aspartyl protease [archaeon]